MVQVVTSPSVIANLVRLILLALFTHCGFNSALAGSGSDIDWDAERQHWAYRAIFAADLKPPISNASTAWARGPLDHFVFQRMTQEGFSPADVAEPGKLLRRLTFALTGLPPTFAEAAAFADAVDPDAAYVAAVERLLNSPRFGEKFASMWLTVARYAEDQAHQVGSDSKHFYPNAHLYRQWVIDAFNEDMPYDDFLRYQMAADLLGDHGREHLVALGFLGLGPKYYNRGRLDVLAEEWEDRVDTVTRGLLAVTVACARCHDHKNDAFTMQDYYGLAGVFASTDMWNKRLPGLKPKLDDKGKEKAATPEETMHIVREGNIQNLPVFLRGDVSQKGGKVPRRFLTVLSKGEPGPLDKGNSGRLDLANAITETSKDLAARVFVNRVWSLIIGKPLVASPSNFGKLGAQPTNARLLDFLAADFIANNWSIKSLVRQIVVSATYRQSSLATKAEMQRDPGNDFLARMNRQRLTAEMLRDSLLNASEELDLRGGKSQNISDSTNFRRTLFGRVSRKELNAYLAQFDYPDANIHCAQRSETTTPGQKLYLLNSEFVLARAEAIAANMERNNRSVDDEAAWAFTKVLSRLPDDKELAFTKKFLSPSGSNPERSRRVQFAQALLASNEFLYVD